MADLIQTPQMGEVNVDEVLREYGLENAEESDTTIVQTGEQIISIPTRRNAPSDTVAANVTEDTSEIDIDELFGDIASAAEEIPEEEGTEEDTDESTDDTLSALVPESQNQIVTETPDNNLPASKLSTEEALKLLIPVNSKAAEIDETTSRFSGAAWFAAVQKCTIVLAGMGGIGGYVLYVLSRMKPLQIFIYDDDVVERVNLSGQMYSLSMVGKKKVNAMAQLAKDFSDYHGVMAIPTKFTSETSASDIMICGFDNMEARKIFFNSWVNHVVKHKNPENCLYIDGRLDMESFQVFCMRGDDSYNIKRYSNEYLFSDWQAESIACSMKQTTYCANMIGSVIVNLFTNFVSNTLAPIVERDLPFKTFYDAGMMYFKTES